MLNKKSNLFYGIFICINDELQKITQQNDQFINSINKQQKSSENEYYIYFNNKNMKKQTQSVFESQSTRVSTRSQSFIQANELDHTIKGNLYSAQTPKDLLLPQANFIDQKEFKNNANCFVCLCSFTKTNRAHHCRMCANTCCGKCSSRTINQQRACDVCFLKGSQISYEKKRRQFIKTLKTNNQKLEFYIKGAEEKLDELQKDIIQKQEQYDNEFEALQKETAEFQNRFTTLSQDRQILDERIQQLRSEIQTKKNQLEQLTNDEIEAESSLRAQDTELYMKEQVIQDKKQQILRLQNLAKAEQDKPQEKPKQEISLRKQSSEPQSYDQNALSQIDDIFNQSGAQVLQAPPIKQNKDTPLQRKEECCVCSVM
ncbi:hypothetical protein pb186bvf_008398 [Paramecium bursaria]